MLTWFAVLGPLECLVRGERCRLGGPKPKAVLGTLLLNANRIVPTSTLIEVVWPEGPPPSARNVLQNMVSSLRRVIRQSTGVALLTQSPGYLLKVGSAGLDTRTFKELAAAGAAELSAGHPDIASDHLRTALGVWRGPVLADLAERGYTWPEASTLESARLVVCEDYFEAELALGRHQLVIADLEELVTVFPLRERLCGQLMRALYRVGCPGEALAVYRRTRSMLIEELGIDPGPELRRLEHAILARDENL